MSHLASKVHSADTQLEYNFNKEYMHLHKFGQKFTVAHIGKLTITSSSSRDKNNPPKPS
jgi:hypothetical protein